MDCNSRIVDALLQQIEVPACFCTPSGSLDALDQCSAGWQITAWNGAFPEVWGEIKELPTRDIEEVAAEAGYQGPSWSDIFRSMAIKDEPYTLPYRSDATRTRYTVSITRIEKDLVFLVFRPDRGRRDARFDALAPTGVSDPVRRRLEIAVETMHLGVWDYDPTLNRLEWNDNVYDLFDRDPQEGPFPFSVWREMVLARDVFDSAQGERTFYEEIPIILPDGRFRYMISAAVALRDTQGDTIRVIGALSDITERKLAQEALEDATQEARSLAVHAQNADRAKSEFLANMSHEIRTPMNAVVGMAQVLRDTELSVEQRELVDTILRGGDTLLGLINDILDVSKIEAGRIELEEEPFSLREVIADVTRILAQTAEERSVQLHTDISADVPEVVRGDRTRLRQIVMNLGSNAVKFTQDGEVAFLLRIQEEHADALTVVGEVRDTGIGIAKEKRERIFDPFLQADAGTTRRYGGTGLGLTIVRRLAEAMGGSVQVDSVEGEGSTFTFRVRMGRCTDCGADRLANTTSEGEQFSLRTALDSASSEEPDSHAAPRRVLLVEDNPTNQIVARTILSRDGHDVVVAEDGVVALAMLRSGVFDLVLMDVQMPRMDGYEATHRIRAGEAGEENRSVPIIAMTANALSGDREKTLEAGMDDYISKPFSKERIRDVVSSVAIRGEETLIPVDRYLPVEALRERLMQDDTLIREVLEQFFNDGVRLLQEIRNGFGRGDAKAVFAAAHQLKGAAGNILGSELSDAIGGITEIARGGALDGITPLLHRGIKNFDTMRKIAVAAFGEAIDVTDRSSLEELLE